MSELMQVDSEEFKPLIERSLQSVREEFQDNPYILEALRVLPVGGYRSAIGCFWNAVVDDLRNKIIHRSLPLFNQSIDCSREIKSYEDFQNFVNDDQLIDGGYKIGVIGWEASKVLKHSKETRHIFDGHPKSTDPSVLKVLAMFEDCCRYVLSEPFPPTIIDISDYITQIGSQDFDRNELAIENALSELPEIYKNELANRLYTAYIHTGASTVLRGNIEFVSPSLWAVLPKSVKVQVSRRVDQEIAKGNRRTTDAAFSFVSKAGGMRYLTNGAKRYKLQPLVTELSDSLDDWDAEARLVRELSPYAPYVPQDLIPEYVRALVMTYVGYMGHSSRFSRKDFYADAAIPRITSMFKKFDDFAAEAFVESIVKNKKLYRRIQAPQKLARLRALGHIVHENVSESFSELDLLELLVDETKEEELMDALR
ncbi:MAG: hypothetical protein CMP08_06225 [Xanthomonadales bacterium]|nr:hypothetical protein [Xanthomonadales bacterium]